MVDNLGDIRVDRLPLIAAEGSGFIVLSRVVVGVIVGVLLPKILSAAQLGKFCYFLTFNLFREISLHRFCLC